MLDSSIESINMDDEGINLDDYIDSSSGKITDDNFTALLKKKEQRVAKHMENLRKQKKNAK